MGEDDEEFYVNDFDIRNLILIHDFNGYCIYKISDFSFLVKKPDEEGKPCSSFVGYFTSLGGCARAIVQTMRTDKLVKRNSFMKQNTESLLTVIEQHDAYIEDLVRELKMIVPTLLKDPEPVPEKEIKPKSKPKNKAQKKVIKLN